MSGESKEAFLGRVTAALADRGQPVDLPDDLEVARVAATDADLVELFAQQVNASAMIAHRVPDAPAMIEKIMELVASTGARSAMVPADELPARDELLARLAEKGVALADTEDRDAAFAADVGITGAASAVAETGSVYIVTGGGHRPLASLAVIRHIIAVRVEQIVPDLLDWAAAAPADPPANGVFITGPSKTSDIEMTLVQGVHGPGEVHVIIIG